MKTICVNCRFLESKFPTGTHRSSLNLLMAINELLPSLIAVVPDEKKCPQNVFAGPIISSSKLLSFSHNLWEQFVFPCFRKQDLHLSLIGTAPFTFNTHNQVMVVHDLNFILVKASFGLAFRYWYRLACLLAAKRAKHIFAISDYTRNNLINHGIDGRKITVFYQGPGIDTSLLSNRESIENVEKHPFVLCVGSLQPHKNLPGIIETFYRIKQKHKRLKLKIVGKKQDHFTELSGLPDKRFEPDIEFTGYVDDNELADYYRMAEVFFFPSFEEGFGLPVVEAFYAGCPVVTSNRSCLPEIAGNAAVLVNPYDITDMANGIDRVLSDSELRVNLVQNGYVRSKLFDWGQAGKVVADKMGRLS